MPQQQLRTVFDRAALAHFCAHVKENIVDMIERMYRLRALGLLHVAVMPEGSTGVKLAPRVEEGLKAFLASPDSSITADRLYGFLYLLKEAQEAVLEGSPFDLGPHQGGVELYASFYACKTAPV